MTPRWRFEAHDAGEAHRDELKPAHLWMMGSVCQSQ